MIVPAVLIASVWLIRHGTRHVLQLAEELDQARRQFGDLQEGDRPDTLVDTLTRLGNHRAFQEELDRQLDAVRRYGHTVALVFIDLDDFKVLNEAGGHAVGDKALAQISKLLRSGLRRSDRPFRVGGDEFAVLMPGTRAEEAHTVMRRILSTSSSRAASRASSAESRSRPASRQRPTWASTGRTSTLAPTTRCTRRSGKAVPPSASSTPPRTTGR